MKLAQTTILALLATSAMAAPTVENMGANSNSNNLVVKREEVTNIMAQFHELKALKVKRDLIGDDEAALIELDKRAGSVLDNLITSVISSGLISTVWDDITGNAQLKSAVVSIGKAVISAVISNGGALISGLWDSHVLQDVFSKVLDNPDLRSAVIGAGEALIKTALSLVKNFLGGSSSAATTTAAGAATTTTAAAATTTAAAKREDVDERDFDDIAALLSQFNVEDFESYVKDFLSSDELSSMLDKRTLASTLATVFDSIIAKIKADPTGALNLAKTALHYGLVIGEDLYAWSKSSGLLTKLVSWLSSSSNSIIAAVGRVLGEITGSTATSKRDFVEGEYLSERSLGSVFSEVFGAIETELIEFLEGSSNAFLQILGEILAALTGKSGSSGSSGTTVATTTAAPKAAATTAAVASVTAVPTVTTTDNLDFLSAYAVPGATTLYKAKRMAY